MAAAGALQSLAFVHGTWLWWLALAGAAGLVWRLDSARGARDGAWLGWCYGTAWLLAGVWWLFISMHRYGGLPAWLAALAVLLLAAVLSLYLAAAAALYVRWRSGRSTDALLFAALWLAAEWARGVLFTGFPWLASGYSQIDSPLAALAPWLGVHGVGAVLAAIAALLSRVLPSPAGSASPGRWQPVWVAAALVAVLAALPVPSFTRATGTLAVELLQTNVAQDEKFSEQRMPAMLQWVAQQLTSSRADLVVAPETAVPLLPAQLADLAPGYWDLLRRHFAAGTQAALVGVPLGDYERGYTNSVAGLSAETFGLPGGGYRYDKMHLVPFGEFIPRGFRWFTEMMDIPLGDFTRGVPNPPSFRVKGERAAPNICYEDLFGEELARRFGDAAAAPTLFVNISNIGWFGDTIAIAQHLNISRMRSLEFQRPMLRATNTGATAAIDHRGGVTAQLPSFQRAVLAASVQGRSGNTPYAHWASRLGAWPLPVVALLTVLACGRWRRAS